MAKVVVGANHKGGVGKTTTTVNLAAALTAEHREYRVLLVDLDGQRSASRHLGVLDQEEGQTVFDLLCGDGSPIEPRQLSPTLFLLPGDHRLNTADVFVGKLPAQDRGVLLRRALEQYQERFDFIIIDCPPAMGALTINALMAAHCFFIPVLPEYLGLEGVSDTIDLATNIQANRDGAPHNLGIVFNKTDDRIKLTREFIDMIRERYGKLVFKNEITTNVKLTEAPSFGQTIYQYSPRSPGRHAFERFTVEFLARMALDR